MAPDTGEVIATCMCSAPIGSIPSPIDIDELASGIALEDSGIGDELWPPAAVEGCPEEHAAATSAIAHTPTAPRKAEPGRERPGEQDMSMDRAPPQVPAPAQGHHRRRLRYRLLKTPPQRL